MDGNPEAGGSEIAVPEQVVTETVSDEFLQNVQSAVNSTGVLGRVGVIETENGPMTVIFMEEGADASELGLTDGAVIGTEDGNQIEYRVLEEGFTETLEEGQVIDTSVSQAAAIMDTIVSTSGDGVVAIDTSAGGGSGVVAAIEEDTGVSAMQIGPEVDIGFEPTTIEQTVSTDVNTTQDVTSGGTVYVTEAGEVISSNGGTFIIQEDGQVVSSLGGQDSFIQTQGQDVVSTVADENTCFQIQGGGAVIPSESLSSASTVQTVQADFPMKTDDSVYVQVNDVEQMQATTSNTDANAFVNIENSTRVNTNADGSPFIQVYTNNHGDVTEVQYTAVKLDEPQPGSNSVFQPTAIAAPVATPVAAPVAAPVTVAPRPPVLAATQSSVLIPQFPSVSRRVGAAAYTAQKLISTPAILTGSNRGMQPPKSATKSTYAIQQAGKAASVGAIGGKLPQIITIPKFANVAPTIQTAPTLQNVAKKQKTAVSQLPSTQAVTIGRKPADVSVMQGVPAGNAITYGTTTTISKKQLVEQELIRSKAKQSVPARSTGVQYVDIHGQVITQPAPTLPKVPEKVATPVSATPALPHTTEIPQTIKVPNSDITIELYQDGTLVTRDKMGTNYSQLKLEDLGLDKNMLHGETNIELVVVQSDGKEVRATIKTQGSMFQNTSTPTKSASPVKTAVPVKSPSKVPMPNLKGPMTATPMVMGSPIASQSNIAGAENHAVDIKPDIGERKPAVAVVGDADPRPYKCSMCPRTFKFYRTYKCHEIVHFKATNFTCPLCKRLFARETNLNSHLELHRKKSKEAVLKSVANMTKMKKYVPPKKEKSAKAITSEWKCERCNELFPTSHSLQKHKQSVHNDNEQMSCPICKKVFKTKFGVQRHLKLHVEPFRCIFCDASHKDKDALIMHVKEVHPQKNYSCTLCLESLQTKKSYWNHIKLVHGDSNEGKELLKSYAVFECSYCIKRFHKHAVLSRHLLVHSEKKKFACPHCLYRFNKNWKLQAHIQRLHKSNHNPCSKCGKVFKMSEELNRHYSKFHVGPFACESCEKTFDDLSHLDDHAFSEHNVTYPCKVCTEIFKTRLTLSFHNDTDHAAANTCLCDLCGEGFIYKTKLKAHLVNTHFDGDREEMYHDYPEMKRVKDWKGPYECKICNSEVRYRVALKLHYLNNHFKNDPTAMYEAYPYLKDFPDPQDNVVCDHCGKSFMQMTHLNMHLRTHGVHVSLSTGNEKSMEKLSSSSEEEEEEDEIVYIEQDKDKGSGNKMPKGAALKKQNKSQDDENDTFDFECGAGDGEKSELKKKIKQKTSTPKPKMSKSKKRRSSVLLICKECEEIFKTEEDFDDHMANEHGKIGKIRRREIKDETPEELEEIVVPKELQNRWLKACKLCTKSFTQLHTLRNHAEKVHPDDVEDIMKDMSEKKSEHSSPQSTYKKVQCPECSEFMSSAYSLHRHMDRMHGIRTVGSTGQVVTPVVKKKPAPRKSSARKSVQKSKIDTSSSDMSSFLGMNFSLEKKSDAASPSKNHRCKTCGESFHRMATLRKHLRTHEAESDESEAEDNLQKALYTCKDCNNTYSTIAGLVFHTKNKHPDVDDAALKTKLTEEEKEQKPTVQGNRGGPTFPCDECGKLYFTVAGVLYHVRTRHPDLDDTEIRPKLIELEKQRKGVTPKKKIEKEPLFSCEVCDAMYHTVGGVVYHVRTRHPELDEREVRSRLVEIEKAMKLEQEKNPIKVEDDNEAVKVEEMSVKTEAMPEFKIPENISSKKIAQIKKEFACKICGSTYNSMKGLEMHEELIHPIHTESKKVSKSGRVITKSKRLSDYFECPECSKYYPEELHLKQHMRMKHKIEVFAKKGNKKPVDSSEHFRKTRKGYECNSCKRYFAKYFHLARHIRIKHKITISRTQEDTTDAENIKDENESAVLKGKVTKSHGEDTRRGKHCCTQCGKTFTANMQLQKHLAMDHANIKKAISLFSCTKCPRNFKTKANLSDHVKTHTHSLKTMLSCDICFATFRRETSLKFHKLSHTKNTSTVTRSRVELKAIKEEKPSNVKDYKCKLCSRLFTSERTLETHTRHVHEKKEDTMKNFKCKQCSRQFTAEWTLQSHIRHMHKENIPLKKKNVDVIALYKSANRTCNYCKTKFTTNYGLKLHVVNVHKKTVKEWHLPTVDKRYRSQKSKSESKTLRSKNPVEEKKSGRPSTAKGKPAKLDSKTMKSNASSTLNVCEECTKTFSSAHHLKQHQRVHKAKKEKEESNSDLEKTKTAHAEESDDDSISQKELMSRPVVQQCLYCSDCGQVCWTQQSYTSHLQQFHPEQLAVDTDSADESFTADNDGKSETMETDDESSKIRGSRRSTTGPSKHKCEVCNRVHWTKKSFDDHMRKCHPDKFIEMQEEESQGSAVEFVNDEGTSSKYLQIVSHSDIPVNNEKLVAVPMVLLERMPAENESSNIDDTDQSDLISPEPDAGDGIEVGEKQEHEDEHTVEAPTEMTEKINNLENEEIDTTEDKMEISGEDMEQSESEGNIDSKLDETVETKAEDDKGITCEEHMKLSNDPTISEMDSEAAVEDRTDDKNRVVTDLNIDEQTVPEKNEDLNLISSNQEDGAEPNDSENNAPWSGENEDMNKIPSSHSETETNLSESVSLNDDNADKSVTSNVQVGQHEQSMSEDVTQKASEPEINEVPFKSTEDLHSDDKDDLEEDYEEITLGADFHQDHADTGLDHLEPPEQEQVSATEECPRIETELKHERVGEIQIETVPECDDDQIVEEEYSEMSDEQNRNGAVNDDQFHEVQRNHTDDLKDAETDYISHEQQLTEVPVTEQSTDGLLKTEQFVDEDAGKTTDVLVSEDGSAKWEHSVGIDGGTSLVGNIRSEKQTEVGEVGAMNVELDPEFNESRHLGENKMPEGYSGVEIEESTHPE